jgi:hypothetical protein
VAIVDDRRENVKGQIAAHRRWTVEAFRRGLERPARRPLGLGYVSIEYVLVGAAAYHMGDGQAIIYPLQLSDELEDLDESVRIHLGAENWERWKVLKAEVNFHPDTVSRLWKEIGDSLAEAARNVGLFASDTPVEAPVDMYWPTFSSQPSGGI